jgi:SAM-dependent methyltransferase
MIGEPQVSKAPFRRFLKHNPYPGPLTDGLFFRDKMRAIHRVAPSVVSGAVLEVGGGRSGLTKLLYPGANVTNLDLDESCVTAAANRAAGVTLVHGDAVAMPFASESFALITMFDLLEHVLDDAAVTREALRVLKPGGHVLVTTPQRERWKYPYHNWLQRIGRQESELMTEWGHVRRGYTEAELESVFGVPVLRSTTFLNPLLAVSHDIAFSRLSRSSRLILHALVAPVSMVGWVRSDHRNDGLEIALHLRKSV